MADDEVKSNRQFNSGASPYNALDFMIENAIKQKVNVAIPVRVDSCTAPGPDGAAGYVSATPLIAQRDADGKTLEQVSVPQMPFFRLSCGTAAIVADPQPGDVGVAVFAQSDISGLQAGKSETVAPGSFRSFDMSDGIYLGGILGQAPTTYIHLDPENGEIHIKSPQKVTVETKAVEVKADTVQVQAGQSVTLDTPLVTVTGRLVQTGENGGGASSFKGGFTNTGGTITSNGITLETHTHTGVQSGGDNTGGPQ